MEGLKRFGILAHSSEGAALCFLTFCREGFRQLGQHMAKGDCIFAATGVTDGSLLSGVHTRQKCVTTESIVMRASTGTVRRVSTEYRDLVHRGL